MWEPDLEQAHKNAATMMEEDECRKVNMWKDTKQKNIKTIFRIE